MQRLGRKGHPVYRVVVQDSRQSPTSGKYIALLGNYDPHTKTANITKDKAEHYLKHGAQPSDRVAKLFIDEKIALPKWVTKPVKHKRDTRNPDKLRRNRPPGEPAPEKPAEPAEEPSPDEAADTVAKADAAEETAAENTTPPEPAEPAEKSEGDNVPESQDEPAAPAEAPAEETEPAADSAENKA